MTYSTTHLFFFLSNHILNNSLVLLFLQSHTQQPPCSRFFPITKSTTHSSSYFSNHILNNLSVFLSFHFFDIIVNNRLDLFLLQSHSQQLITLHSSSITKSTTHLSPYFFDHNLTILLSRLSTPLIT